MLVNNGELFFSRTAHRQTNSDQKPIYYSKYASSEKEMAQFRVAAA
jgi:hypothetical protein